ncbi:MAG: FHA domain-containing protein [Ahrensia sp.]
MSDERERALALLSLAAIGVDLMTVLMLTVGTMALVKTMPFVNVYAFVFEGWMTAALFVIFTVIHFIFVELVFGGHSLGRLSTGLRLVDSDGAHTAPLGARFKRFVAVGACLGLRSLKLSCLPTYDKYERCRVKSDWAGAADAVESRKRTGTPAKGPAGTVLKIISGPDAGQSASLAALVGTTKKQIFIIGRDPAYANLVLAKDLRVSRVHARIAWVGGRFLLIDGAAANKPSTHGTMVNSRKASAQKPTVLTKGSTISIGDSKIVLQ